MLDELVTTLRRRGGTRMRTALTGRDPLDPAELAHADDPGLFGPASVAWRVHGDTAMLIGGLRALLYQTLHPGAMAGVADHSDYRNDPWGRLHRTGRFIAATTYGSTPTAERAIAAVTAIHERVVGARSDGVPYRANDPHLLGWVHATEVDSFLSAYGRYGGSSLTRTERDRYVAEMAEVGGRLGVIEPPTDTAALAARLDRYRSECRSDDLVSDAVTFLLVPPVTFLARGPYRVIGAAAVASLPGWARRMLHLPVPPGFDTMAIRPAATALTRGLGWVLDDPDRADRPRPRPA
ncbi:MAG: oxygenase MpaB family protein [Acidimicrobiales bacterium]